jgi:hypothetical protein|tara:strand:- start:71 stop:418 length:348 start_codon:yes stop_codon:yes gene_type:complete
MAQKKKPKRRIQDVVRKHLVAPKYEKKKFWAKEMMILKRLMQKYNNEDFWHKVNFNKEINSFAQFYALPFNKMLETKYQEFHLKIEKSNSPTIGDKTGTDRTFSSTKTLKNFLNG